MYKPRPQRQAQPQASLASSGRVDSGVLADMNR